MDRERFGGTIEPMKCAGCKAAFAKGDAVVTRGKKHLCMPCAMKSGSASGAVTVYGEKPKRSAGASRRTLEDLVLHHTHRDFKSGRQVLVHRGGATALARVGALSDSELRALLPARLR